MLLIASGSGLGLPQQVTLLVMGQDESVSHEAQVAGVAGVVFSPAAA